MRWRVLLDVAVQVAFVAAAAALVYAVVLRPAAPQTGQARSNTPVRRPEPPLPAEPVSLNGAITKGSRDAKVALIEYSDFECPFCGRFARDTLPLLEEEYVRPGRVLVGFRHYPLRIHPRAPKAAEAVECAGEQKKFWEMHDRLFQEPRQLEEASLRAHAREIGLNGQAFDACLDGRMTAKIQADMDEGRRLKVTRTKADG
jgi:protein-disulfide isomerase